MFNIDKVKCMQCDNDNTWNLKFSTLEIDDNICYLY